MKLLFSGEWLRRRIEAASGSEPEAGPSIGELALDRPDNETAAAQARPVAGDRTAVQLRRALGVVVRG